MPRRRLTKRYSCAMCHKPNTSLTRSGFASRKSMQGIGLPASIFIILVLALMILALSDLTQTGSASVGHNYQAQKAFFAAESGAQIGLNRIFVGGSACTASMGSIDFNATSPNTGLESCSADLVCTQDLVLGERFYTLLSLGECGDGFDKAQRTVQVRARSN